MSERSSHTLLGAFVLGGLIIAIVVFLFTAGERYNRSGAQHIVMVFDGSVTGLNKGAPVALRGAEIGEVTDIRVRFDQGQGLNIVMQVEAVIDESRVTREAEAERTIGRELIDAGLRAQLNNQSLLTGLLYVQLDFFPDTEVQLRAEDSPLFEIPTIASPFDQLFQQFDRLNLPQLAADLQVVAKALRTTTDTDTFRNLPATLERTLTSTADVAEEVRSLIDRLEPQLEQTLSSTTSVARTAERELPLIAQRFEQSLAQLNDTLRSFETAAQRAEGFLDPESPTLYQLNSTLAEMARASRAINALARSLEEQPQSLLLGRPDTTDEDAP